MEHHGLKVAEGSEVTNLTAPTGTAFPGDENAGEFFFRTDENKLYLYGNSSWDEVQTGTGAALANFQDNGSVGEVYYDHGGGGQTLRLSTSATGLTYTGLLTGTQARYEGTNAYIEFHDTDSGTDTLDHFRINQFGANLQIEAKNNSWAHVRNVANFTHAGNLELPVGNLIATSGGVTATSGTGAFQTVNVSTTTTSDVVRVSGSSAYLEIGDTGVADSWRLYPTALGVLELRTYTGKWSGTSERSMRITRDAGVELFYNGGVTLETESFGASVTGRLDATSVRTDNTNLNGGFQFSTGGAGDHYAWAPEATAATLYSYTSEWSGTAERLISATKDAGVTLYHNNGVKLVTTATGATITGRAESLAFRTDNTNLTGGFQMATNGGEHYAWAPEATAATLYSYSGEWSGTAERLISATKDAGVSLYYNNVVKFETISTGIEVFGRIDMPNNTNIYARNAGNSADVPLIKLDNVNRVEVGSNGANSTEIHGAVVYLVDSGTTRLTTSSSGVNITGILTADTMRMANAQYLVGRDAGNSTDVSLIRVSTTNQVEVGSTSHQTEIHGSSVRLVDGGVDVLTTSGTTVDIPAKLTAGTFSAGNTEYYTGRDQGNSVDVGLIRVSTANQVEVGTTSYQTEIHGSSVRLVDSGVDVLTTSGTTVDIPGALTIGTWLLDNTQHLYGRDQGNSANIPLIRADTANRVEVGSSSPYQTEIHGSVVTILDSGVIRLTTSSTGVDITGILTADTMQVANAQYLVGRDQGNSANIPLIRADTANRVEVGSASPYQTEIHGSIVTILDSGVIRLTTSSTGVDITGIFTADTMRLANTQYLVARNQAGSADVNLIALDTANDVVMGGSSNDTEIHGRTVEIYDNGVLMLQTTGTGAGVNIVKPTTIEGNLYPSVTGDADQVLTTDGAGTLTWEDGGGATLANFQDNGSAGEITFGGTNVKLASTTTGVDITGDLDMTSANTIDAAILVGINRNSLQATAGKHFGINMRNSDIMGIGGIFGNDSVDGFAEGINWPTDTTPAGQMDGTIIPLVANWNGIYADSATNELIYSQEGTESVIINTTTIADGSIGTIAANIFLAEGTGGVVRFHDTDNGTSGLDHFQFNAEADHVAFQDLSNGFAAITGTMAKFFHSGAVELYYDNTKTFETTATGILTTGTSKADIFLAEGTASILRFHDTDNGVSGNDHFQFNGEADFIGMYGLTDGFAGLSGTIAIFPHPGTTDSLELYCNATKRFETTTTGATVFGALTAGTNLYPTVQGDADQVLTTDGAGTLTWEDAASGIDLAADYTWTGTHTFNASNTNVNGILRVYGADLHTGTKLYLSNATEIEGFESSGFGTASIGAVSINNQVIIGDITHETHIRGDEISLYSVATSTQNVKMETTSIGMALTNGSDLKFFEGVANTVTSPVNYISLTAPVSVTADVAYILPEAPAADGYVMASTTAGVMSWTNSITAFTVTGELTAGGNAFPTNTGTSGYYLETDGAGQTSWTAVAEGSSLENFQDNSAVAEIYYDHGQGGETLIAVTSATGMDITGDLTVSGDMKVGDGTGSPATATVDFDSSGLATNYDVQLSVSGGTATDGEGTLTINAIETDVLGTLNVSTSDVSVLTIGDAIANTPEIQFQSGGAGADYDTRITSTGGTASDGEGTLNIDADSVEVSCDVSLTGGDIVVDSIDKNLDLFTRKAMCHVEIGGSPSPLLTNFFGVTSVTRNGAGDFSLTMTDSWADTAAARAKIFATVSRHFLSGGVCNVTRVDISSTNQVDIIFQDATPANADPTYFSVTVEHVV